MPWQKPIAIVRRFLFRWQRIAEVPMPLLAVLIVRVVAKIDLVVLLAAATDRTDVPVATCRRQHYFNEQHLRRLKSLPAEPAMGLSKAEKTLPDRMNCS